MSLQLFIFNRASVESNTDHSHQSQAEEPFDKRGRLLGSGVRVNLGAVFTCIFGTESLRSVYFRRTWNEKKKFATFLKILWVAVRWWREDWWRGDESEGGEADRVLVVMEMLRPHLRTLSGAGDAGRDGWYSKLKSVSVSLSTIPLSQAQKSAFNVPIMPLGT
ncbi:hypothetical protein E2C01_012508 [Portunus trituberculatus]|uniref:Uncharacterized protein n=1 Tax=Portunus trituberculatus TaxID=210409 RepID=A0A5B7DDX6_PORTR|nr:hypothetical protein [Portunus trituberculatus]